jgi:hypothetical protein
MEENYSHIWLAITSVSNFRKVGKFELDGDNLKKDIRSLQYNIHMLHRDFEALKDSVKNGS